MIFKSVNDIHSEIRCLISHVRHKNNAFTAGERLRIENILWKANAAIGEDFLTRERYEKLFATGENPYKAKKVRKC